MIKFDARVGKDKKYWDRQGGKYKRYWRLDASLSDIIAGNVDADRTVLEVAAGTGLIALELAGRVAQIYGVDKEVIKDPGDPSSMLYIVAEEGGEGC